jgi:hypothetical protein
MIVVVDRRFIVGGYTDMSTRGGRLWCWCGEIDDEPLGTLHGSYPTIEAANEGMISDRRAWLSRCAEDGCTTCPKAVEGT